KMISGRFNSNFHKNIIYTSDEGLSILRQQSQVVFFFVFDASSDFHYTCVWCLTTGKNKDIDCKILHHIFILLNYDRMLFRNGIIKGGEISVYRNNHYRM
ncbi:hypothetical protein MXB_3594, partial [Myxobolus squamalis]